VKIHTIAAITVPSLTPWKQGKSNLSKKYSSRVQKKNVIAAMNQQEVIWKGSSKKRLNLKF